VATEDASVYVPGVGFRPSTGGLALAEQVTLVKDPEHALRVMLLVSTSERGTEFAFEMQDAPREAAARVGNVDYGWHNRLQVELRDATGVPVARSRSSGESSSLGQHEFGFLRQDLIFEPLSPETRRVTFVIRGALGDWDIPIELVPLAERGVTAIRPPRAELERHGITIRVRGVASTATETILDVEAVAAPTVRSIVGIGAWPMRYEHDELLVLVDDRGHRVEEIAPQERPRSLRGGNRTVATFAALSPDAKELTLIVPGVIVEESERLDIALPVHAPTEAKFGPYPMTIRWADVVDNLRPAPNEPPTRGLEVQVRPAGWHGDRRVLRPTRVDVDGGNRSHGFGVGPDSDGWTFNVPLPEGASAKTATLFDPIVKVRGPWEIRWRR
jgi:hypothetical protein